MKFSNLHVGRIKALFVVAIMLVCVLSLSAQSFDGYYDDAVVVNRNVTSMGIYTVTVNTAENNYAVLFYAPGERSALACYNGKYQYWEYRRGFGYQDKKTPAFDMSQINLSTILTKVDSRINLNRTELNPDSLLPISQYLDPSVCYDDAVVVNRNVTSMDIYKVSVNSAENDYLILFYAPGEKSPLACYNGKYQYWEYRRGFGYQDKKTPAFDMSKIDLKKILTKVDSRIDLNRNFPEGVTELTPLSKAGGAAPVVTTPKTTATTTSSTTTTQKTTTTTTTSPKTQNVVILSTPDESNGWYDTAAEYNTSITSMGPYSIFFNIRKGDFALAMFSYPGDNAYIACYDLMYQYWHYRRGYNGYQVNSSPYFDMSYVDTSKFFTKVDKRITLNREVSKGETSLKPLAEKDAAALLGNLAINGKTYEKTGFASVNGVTISGSGKDGVFINGRTVTLSPYIIGKYEVTQELYEAIMNDTPSSYTKSNLTSGEKQQFRPVERVDFIEVATFCNKLSEMQGLTPAFVIKGNEVTVDITKNGWRVPTEAEWECAARGGNPSDTTAWNNLFGGGRDAKDALNYAWVKENSNTVTHEVGLKKPNALGLYDTLGNVLEWCADWYTGIKSGTATNPTGLSIGTDRSCRGGSKNAGDTINVLTRAHEPPEKYYNNLGFRLCRTNTGSTVAAVAPAAMSTKPLSLASFSLYDSYPDYGTRGGGYAELSGDVINVYIPVSFTDRTTYWVDMGFADTNVAKIKSSKVCGEADPDWGQATFYDGDKSSNSSFSWEVKNNDKIDVVFKDGSVKTLTVKVSSIPAVYYQTGAGYEDGFRPFVFFQFKDVDNKSDLKLSDIYFVRNECGAEFDELVADTMPWYDNDPNGQGYYVYLKNVKRTGIVSVNVKKNGTAAAVTRNAVEKDYYYLPASFSDIVINGKTYEKTGFAEAKYYYSTLYGSGKDGVFINGRDVTFTNGFMIGKYPVTQELYEAVMNDAPSAGKKDTLTPGERQELRPVELIWYPEVAEFCNKLSKMQGLEPVFTINGDNVTFDITKNGWRIPTEAEWEFAARGGNPNVEELWNNLYAGAKDENDALNYAWVKANSNGVTHEVGLKKPNALGLYDILGNVYEWCLDWYDTIGRGSVTDPVGPSSGTERVQRSCSKGSKSVLPVTTRDSGLPKKAYNDLGFRLCRTLSW